MFDSKKKESIIHFRCHERQRQIKPSVLKSSLKTSTDNLCGPSEEGNRKIEKAKAEGLSKI